MKEVKGEADGKIVKTGWRPQEAEIAGDIHMKE